MEDMDPALVPLSRKVADKVLGVLAPGSVLVSMSEIAGSFSNSTWLIAGVDGRGEAIKLVARRYRGGWSAPAKRARLEFRALQLVEGTSVLAPRLLLLDEGGAILGAPGIVTGFVEGHHVIAPGGDHSWATRLATTLVDIHAVECDAARDQLLDANREALYFLKAGTVPNDMMGHPDGARVWHAVHDAATSLVPVEPSLVHIDYWPGNILWRDREIAAVVDWEEAACGDLAIDVAYMRMDMFVPGFRDDADVFLAAYERVTGRRLENLAFWELAASARAMPDPGDGMAELRQPGYDGATEDDARRNLRDFIASAMDRLE